MESDELMDESTPSNGNRYVQIIERIFRKKYEPGSERVPFERLDIETTADELDIALPKNLGDVIYSFKYRTPLPDSVKEKAPSDKVWVIVSRGRSKYAFEAKTMARIRPDEMLVVTKVPDATPGLVTRYALDDEQALLTKLHYNRLIDIFTGVTCYSIRAAGGAFRRRTAQVPEPPGSVLNASATSSAKRSMNVAQETPIQSCR